MGAGEEVEAAAEGAAEGESAGHDRSVRGAHHQSAGRDRSAREEEDMRIVGPEKVEVGAAVAEAARLRP